MKWAIEIQKSDLGKRNLIDLLHGLGFSLVDGIEYPALTSPAIDACPTAGDAFEIAKAVRAAFKGPAKIDVELVLGSVIDFSTTPPCRHVFLEIASCVMKVTMDTVTLTISPPRGLSPADLDRWNVE